MKRILITGAGSYIGTYVENYLSQWPEDYQVDTIDMIDGSWKKRSFRGYDAVYHVAGIVHREKAKNDPTQTALYSSVNTHLAIETAKKAKAEGVKQFLFMSSASVYGLTASVGQVVTITKDTPLKPVDNYGISKAKAEQGLQALAGDGFKLTILRPPMVYGKGCRGNYVTLAKLANKLPVFPYVNNRRSMLYMENLAEFVRLLIEDEAEGIFCPQNREYVNTSEMVRSIAKANGRHIVILHGVGWMLKLLRLLTDKVDKAFGSLCYDRELSAYPKDYCRKNLEESIRETEG